MPSYEMIDIRTFRPLIPAKGSRGNVVVAPSVTNRNTTMLTFVNPKLSEEHIYALDLNPDLPVSDSFHVQPAPTGTWWSPQDWKLVVDPTSMFSAFNGSPEKGDAFIIDNQPGILGRWDYVSAYVTLDGTLIDEPRDWSTFVGFKKWSVSIPASDPLKPTVITAYERE